MNEDIQISYSKLMERLKEHRKKLETEKPYGWEWEENGINAAILLAGLCRAEARNLPAVDAVEVEHGTWMPHGDGFVSRWHTCSECGEEIWNPDIGREKYCWNCGAHMDGRREDGDG